jgi:hypothetical protein
MAGGALGPPAARWLGRRASHNAGRPRCRCRPTVRTKVSRAWTAVGAGFGRLAAATPPSRWRAGSTASQPAASDPLTAHCMGGPAAPGLIGVLVGQASATNTIMTAASTPALSRLTATRCHAGAWPAASGNVRVRRMAQSGRICPSAPATDHDHALTHWPQVTGWWSGGHRLVAVGRCRIGAGAGRCGRRAGGMASVPRGAGRAAQLRRCWPASPTRWRRCRAADQPAILASRPPAASRPVSGPATLRLWCACRPGATIGCRLLPRGVAQAADPAQAGGVLP